MFRLSKCFLPVLLVVCTSPLHAGAQTVPRPLTSKEIVDLVYQLPKHPEKRDEIVEQIRTRGIGFPLTRGLRSLVATKSGSDPLLRRTLEEAERRRTNPAASTLPSEAEANELLERARVATLAAAEAMPDFIVKQVIRRTAAYGNTNNWIPLDNLSVAVSYRANIGEEYKVLTVNGLPPGAEVKEGKSYSKYVGGPSSTGVEYITSLAAMFSPESKTTFKPVDTDLLQTRRTIVYEYEVKKLFSALKLIQGDLITQVGSRGRIWIDRETNRVVRFEQIVTEIAPGFPVIGASTLIDFDWVMIADKKYMLPTRSDVLITSIHKDQQVLQSRLDIRFRGYQKFGAELKVIDEIDEKDFPPEKPEKP